MTKEQQDLVWACLPKVERAQMRRDYPSDGSEWDDGYKSALKRVFGHRNLTSDTEPEELLMAKKKQVMTALCRAANLQNDKEEDWIRAGEEIEFTLTQLFGDKCLPDKDSDTDVPKPKFDIGQKVIMKLNGSIRKISSRKYTTKGYQYFFEGFDYADYSFEQGMEPYTEESRNLSQDAANCDKSEDNQLKDNMKEKELNLLELLKGCEGMKIFLPDEGYVTIRSFGNNSIIVEDKNDHMINLVGDETLCIRSTGFAYIYPTQESFEQNPLSAAKAWQEWKEARKPKYTLQAQLRLISNNGKTVEDCENVEVEMSDIDLTKAAEAVRATLAKFHEENSIK